MTAYIMLVTALFGTAPPPDSDTQQPPPRCEAGWWYPVLGASERTGLPLDPRVRLPVSWGRSAPDLSVLDVLVVDPQGQAVAGTVSAYVDSGLSTVPLWRPSAPLEPDTRYAVRVRVPAPTGPEYVTCTGITAIDTTLGVTTGAGQVLSARLDVTWFRTIDDYVIRDEYVALDVCDEPGAKACAESSACCVRGEVDYSRRLEGYAAYVSMQGEPDDYELRVAVSTGEPPVRSAINSLPSAFMVKLVAGPDDPVVPVCATLTLYRVLDDRVVDTVDACTVVAEHIAGPTPDAQPCSPWECMRFPGVPPADGDPIAEPTPAAPPDDGCAGGGAGWSLAAALALLGLGLGRARAGRTWPTRGRAGPLRGAAARSR